MLGLTVEKEGQNSPNEKFWLSDKPLREAVAIWAPYIGQCPVGHFCISAYCQFVTIYLFHTKETNGI